jgi:tRNA-modifying protein YgfZ
MRVQWKSVPLDSLGVLRARGADVHTFLQGQLSNDMSRLSAQRSLLAGYHNPQGRVIAVLRLVQVAGDDVLAVLPRELVPRLASRLGKFILRSKVKLSDDCAHWQIYGLIGAGGAEAPYAGVLPPLPEGVQEVGEARVVRIGAARLLLLSPRGSAALPELPPASLSDWQLGAIAAGEPQVYNATTEEFVAQMLNLDALDAIAFGKGCYTGQEIIARAHYRGRVKRRMQRFLSRAGVELKPGDAGTLADGRPFKVVQAAQRADGRCEFLAVCALPAQAAETPSEPAPVAGSTLLEAADLELPYALPD